MVKTTNQLRKRHRTGIPPNKSLDCSHTAGKMGRCTRDQRTGGQNLQDIPFCWGETTSFPDTTVYTYLFTNLHTILVWYLYIMYTCIHIYIYICVYIYIYRHELHYIYIYAYVSDICIRIAQKQVSCLIWFFHPTHPEHIHEVNQNFEHLSREMAGVSDIVGRTQQEGQGSKNGFKKPFGQLVSCWYPLVMTNIAMV